MSKSFKILVVLYLCMQITTQAEAQGPWRELPRPTSKGLYRLSFLDSLNGWVAGFNGTMLKTTNGGTTWQIQNPSVTTDIHKVFALNSRYVWALTFQQFVDTSTYYGTRILKTTNGGATWTNQLYPVWGEFFNSIVFLDSLRGWMGGEYGRLMNTTNGGATWIPAEVDSSIYANWAIVNIRFLTPSYGFALGGRMDIVGVVWRTTNGGLRWTPDGISPEPVHDMHMVDSLHLVGIVGDVDFGASMVRTRDGGQLWEYTFLNILGLPAALSFRTNAEAWAPLGFAGSLMYTKDTANTWTTLETPGRIPIYDLVFTDSSTGYAIGDSGTILKYDAATTSVGEIVQPTPTLFALHQNYPNPFNPTTTISYTIPREGFVTLRVFNVLGQQVRMVVNQEKEAGRHFVNFSADGLAGGVYLYRLNVGSSIDVKKMILVR